MISTSILKEQRVSFVTDFEDEQTMRNELLAVREKRIREAFLDDDPGIFRIIELTIKAVSSVMMGANLQLLALQLLYGVPLSVKPNPWGFCLNSLIIGAVFFSWVRPKREGDGLEK